MFTSSPILRWRQQKQYYNLTGFKCLKCNTIYYPKKYFCSCGHQEFQEINLSGQGKLLSFTQITTPPTIFANQAPYCIGLIELKEGPKLIAQLADIELKNLKIGLKVQSELRKYYSFDNKSIINYGLKFIIIK